MPVVAVAAAAASFTAGTAAFAAATTIGGMVAAGATVVGSALSIIGTVTGNSKLSKIGGILAIGGMIGTGVVNSMAETAANAAGNAATEGLAKAGAEGAAEAASSGLAAESARFSDAAFDAGMPGAASAAPNAAQSTARGLIDSGMQARAPMTDVQSQAAVDASRQSIAPIDSAKPFATQEINAMDANTTDTAQALNIDPFANESEKLLRQQAQAQAGGGNLGGYFDKFGRWVKDNKELAYLGANFASGLLPSEAEKAQTELMKQRTEADRRRALWASGRTA